MCQSHLDLVHLKTACKRKRKRCETGFFFSFFYFFVLFPPFIRTDTSSTASQKPPPPQSPRQKTPLHSFNFTGDGGLTEVVVGGSKASTTLGKAGSSQPAAGRLHMYHSYIINIMWHLKKQNIQADRALKEYK